jgi:hypothetical protein
MSSCRLVLILRNRISSWTKTSVFACSLPAEGETHPFVLFPADLFQSCLNAVHDPFDHPCILPALVPFEHDPRVLDDANRPPSR